MKGLLSIDFMARFVVSEVSVITATGKDGDGLSYVLDVAISSELSLNTASHTESEINLSDFKPFDCKQCNALVSLKDLHPISLSLDWTPFNGKSPSSICDKLIESFDIVLVLSGRFSSFSFDSITSFTPLCLPVLAFTGGPWRPAGRTFTVRVD